MNHHLGGQQRRVGEHGGGGEPGCRQFSQPGIEQRSRDDIHARPAIVAAHADREMQGFDVFCQLFFERKRHGLQQPGTCARRQFCVQRNDLAAGNHQHDAAGRGE